MLRLQLNKIKKKYELYKNNLVNIRKICYNPMKNKVKIELYFIK
jgi:hypothetical protein